MTVLRRGKVVDTMSTGVTTTHKLAEMMVGREVNLTQEKIPTEKGNIVLEVKNIEVKNDLGLSAVHTFYLFQLHSGEILGVAGVDGNGQRELADGINGLRSLEKGEINFADNLTDKFKVGYIPRRPPKNGVDSEF